MTSATNVDFSEQNILNVLETLTETQLDERNFGVIGFDAQGVVQRYNTFESQAAGLSRQRVLGQPLFTVVAPCMNNYLVAQRFEDAVESNDLLDETIGYVLTLRMRPIRVKLRLLSSPGATLRYVLVQRSG
ncbi:MAG: phosphonate transporter [Variovorax sp.]|nr:phosphonate transporter [Variovorax sp.]